jgi:hypothetical protein
VRDIFWLAVIRVVPTLPARLEQVAQDDDIAERVFGPRHRLVAHDDYSETIINIDSPFNIIVTNLRPREIRRLAAYLKLLGEVPLEAHHAEIVHQYAMELRSLTPYLILGNNGSIRIARHQAPRALVIDAYEGIFDHAPEASSSLIRVHAVGRPAIDDVEADLAREFAGSDASGSTALEHIKYMVKENRAARPPPVQRPSLFVFSVGEPVLIVDGPADGEVQDVCVNQYQFSFRDHRKWTEFVDLYKFASDVVWLNKLMELRPETRKYVGVAMPGFVPLPPSPREVLREMLLRQAMEDAEDRALRDEKRNMRKGNDHRLERWKRR